MAPTRQILLHETRDLLVRAGFCVSEPMDPWTAVFDLVARRDDTLLIIKAYTNVDRLQSGGAMELRALAATLKGAPLVVGMRTSRSALEQGVLYLRHAVPIMTLETLSDHLLEGVPPFVYAGPGGRYVDIDGDMLARVRNERNLSLSEMAEAAGVSRRSVQMYEQGMAAQLETAMRLEEFLGVPLVRALDPFGTSPDLDQIRTQISDLQEIEQEVFGKLENLGYNVLPTMGCPFNALSSTERHVFLTGVKAGRPDLNTKVRARVIAQISRVAEQDGVLIVERQVDQQTIGGTPVISRLELDQLDDPEEVLRIIQERGGRSC
ncbi:MAG: transcriptional regulator [Thermoplasmata archaeon]|nr:transcriptional regulator [Thermoplasmata archaeon]NIS10585.1 transcriptional regulator [Thermoplasmata archaeon]NIS18547.1 transcriptional regulator [Thermoplasmata archaeon]NIT75533.1 transcriptional regulator [Thermoplasmata archaeon]NIU47700.1 transcriptional regulator [Thermoplasmata archaeon]